MIMLYFSLSSTGYKLISSSSSYSDQDSDPYQSLCLRFSSNISVFTSGVSIYRNNIILLFALASVFKSKEVINNVFSEYEIILRTFSFKNFSYIISTNLTLILWSLWSSNYIFNELLFRECFFLWFLYSFTESMRTKKKCSWCRLKK